jgi:hypothetical protein
MIEQLISSELGRQKFEDSILCPSDSAATSPGANLWCGEAPRVFVRGA